MTMLVTNGTGPVETNQGTPATANGVTNFTFSGVLGPLKKIPSMYIRSRSETADFAETHYQSGFGRFQLNLSAGDEYDYYIDCNGATVDLSAVDA